LHSYREETQALFAVVVFGSTLSHPLAKPDCTYLHTTKRRKTKAVDKNLKEDAVIVGDW
jgi:hypothetical protein